MEPAVYDLEDLCYSLMGQSSNPHMQWLDWHTVQRHALPARLPGGAALWKKSDGVPDCRGPAFAWGPPKPSPLSDQAYYQFHPEHCQGPDRISVVHLGLAR